MVKISDSRRAELKKPLGILIVDDDITAEAIAEHAGVGASYITVGDASTERASDTWPEFMHGDCGLS